MPPSPTVPETVQQFFVIVKERLTDVTKNGRHKAAWSDSSASKEYETELSILKPHYKTLIWGICTAGTLFASFRISKFAGSLSRTKSGAYQFEKLNNLQGQSKPQQKLSDALSIPIDIFLSLLVGASASLFLTDEVKMQNDLADIPLVKGRSLVSDELCTDFIKEYNNMPPQIWTSKNAAESTSMQAIKTFIENCNKRERLVSDRQKNGMDFKEAAKIPSPGVPHHIPGINRDYSQENS